MKTILLSLFLYCCTIHSYAQSHLPPIRLITADASKIEVTNQATTVIVFPFPVRDGDGGSAELLMEKVPESENVVKLKANSIHMLPTSLHIFTKDGKIYTFDVSFSVKPVTQTYYLLPGAPTSSLVPAVFSDKVNEQQLQQFLCDASLKKARKSRRSSRFKMQLSLRGVYIQNGLLLLRFHIKNRTPLAYQANWVNLYVHDKKVTRRSSIQQLPIHTIYTDPLPKIDGKKGLDYAIIIPQMAIPDRKKITFELQEENGGRRLKTSIRNKDLYRAKPL